MTASAASEPAALSDDAQELLRKPNFAHLATIRTDGTSSIAPVWIDPVDASTVIVSTGDGSHKVANLRRDPRVVISVVDLDNPYEELQLRGVAEIEPDPDMVVLDALSHKYTNQPFRVRFEGCVNAADHHHVVPPHGPRRRAHTRRPLTPAGGRSAATRRPAHRSSEVSSNFH